ncbi:MAG: bifunctional D-glycero-beta-D-manno-heptose-7-phosphate kinase/D-glycero-beta-D-manno-heptose [Pseudomonadota bacterium]|jgi:D-beta-D-heptose 7-phosphate kinase/D-beta-D-heptose 1-phosphate adenosyltransferase
MRLTLPDFKDCRILVVGDVMLDRYWHGTTSRISPEAPVPIVRVQQQQARAGGAANVALNISALGVKTRLIGAVGQDEAAHTLRQLLADQQIACDFVILKNIPTITKLRVLSRHQQLIRLDFEENQLDSVDILSTFEKYLPTIDVVVLSDYGKGTLHQTPQLIELAKKYNKPILVDPKGSDFKKYYGATIITPNLSEFEAVAGDWKNEEQLLEKAEQLREQLALQALLITRSEQGMTLICPPEKPLHLPTRAREVFDVTGAGDTVIGVLSAMLAAKQNWRNAVTLANLAAGLTVSKLGAVSISPAELEYALHTSHQDNGILEENMLFNAVQIAKQRGETIVMTNGCFDILHAGHIQYLKQAKQLGDRLIVAVNDDASVKGLKGKDRPINVLDQRMAVLSALECVDWVVPFSEETPERLICKILPNILVKGGDYHVSQIAGHQCVLEMGGQVKVLDFLDGFSTTQLIERMKQ